MSLLQSTVRAELGASAERLEGSIENSSAELAGSQKQMQMAIETQLSKIRNSLKTSETDLTGRIESTDERATEMSALIINTDTRITDTSVKMTEHFIGQVDRLGKNTSGDLAQLRKDLTQATENKVEGLRTDLKLTDGKIVDVEASLPRKIEESERKTERNRSTLEDKMTTNFEKVEETGKQYVNRMELGAKFADVNLQLGDHNQKLDDILDHVNGEVEEVNDYDERIEAVEDEVRELVASNLLSEIALSGSS